MANAVLPAAVGPIRQMMVFLANTFSIVIFVISFSQDVD